jgi:WD40 repeat protein
VADCEYGSVQISSANSEKVFVNAQLEGNTGSVLLNSNVGLALMRSDTEARVFNLQRGTETMKVEYNELYSVYFHPHGEFLVTAGCYYKSFDHCTASVVQVWDLSTSYEVSRMDYSGEVTAYFTPNGERVISAGCSEYDIIQENASRVRQVHCEKWDIFAWLWASEDLIDLTCASLTRNLTREEWQQYLGAKPYQATCPNLPTPQN